MDLFFSSHGNVIDRSGENCFRLQTKQKLSSLSLKIIEVLIAVPSKILNDPKPTVYHNILFRIAPYLHFAQFDLKLLKYGSWLSGIKSKNFLNLFGKFKFLLIV